MTEAAVQQSKQMTLSTSRVRTTAPVFVPLWNVRLRGRPWRSLRTLSLSPPLFTFIRPLPPLFTFIHPLFIVVSSVFFVIFLILSPSFFFGLAQLGALPRGVFHPLLGKLGKKFALFIGKLEAFGRKISWYLPVLFLSANSFSLVYKERRNFSIFAERLDTYINKTLKYILFSCSYPCASIISSIFSFSSPCLYCPLLSLSYSFVIFFSMSTLLSTILLQVFLIPLNHHSHYPYSHRYSLQPIRTIISTKTNHKTTQRHHQTCCRIRVRTRAKP